MKRVFNNNLYITSVKAAICLGISMSIIFSDTAIAKGIQVDNLDKKIINTINTDGKHDFIIDAPIKWYGDIKKLEQVSEFKFKVPDFLPNGNNIVAYQIRKLSEKSNVIEMFFENLNGNFIFQVFQGDPVEVLKSIENEKTHAIKNSKTEISKEPLKLGGLNGLNITLTTIFPAREATKNNFKESQNISKYFVWENEGLWYSMEYSSISKSEESSNVSVNVSQDNIIKIAQSIKYPGNVRNVNYSIARNASSETPVVNIYDKEDLSKAKELIKFNPKFPVKINDDIKITSSIVGVSCDSDFKDNRINYELNNFYTNKNGSITFNQNKNCKSYESAKVTGYLSDPIDNTMKIKVEKLSYNKNEIFKYSSSGLVPQVNYLWKNDEIYCNVTFYVNIENTDEIVKGFVNSEPIV